MSLATAVSMILEDSQEYESSGASENEDGGQEEPDVTIDTQKQRQSIAMVISFTKMYGFISLGCIIHVIKELQYFKVLLCYFA
jgi:hypothetical protein